jgi:hypothetical protein
MAPEVLLCPDKFEHHQNKEFTEYVYGSQADVWAVGILAFELLTGRAPFSDENRADTYENIVSKDPQIPSWISRYARNFIRQTLSKDPDSRPSVQQLKQHPWLNRFQSESGTGPAQQTRYSSEPGTMSQPMPQSASSFNLGAPTVSKTPERPKIDLQLCLSADTLDTWSSHHMCDRPVPSPTPSPTAMADSRPSPPSNRSSLMLAPLPSTSTSPAVNLAPLRKLSQSAVSAQLMQPASARKSSALQSEPSPLPLAPKLAPLKPLAVNAAPVPAVPERKAGFKLLYSWSTNSSPSPKVSSTTAAAAAAVAAVPAVPAPASAASTLLSFLPSRRGESARPATKAASVQESKASLSGYHVPQPPTYPKLQKSQSICASRSRHDLEAEMAAYTKGLAAQELAAQQQLQAQQVPASARNKGRWFRGGSAASATKQPTAAIKL